MFSRKIFLNILIKYNLLLLLELLFSGKLAYTAHTRVYVYVCHIKYIKFKANDYNLKIFNRDSISPKVKHSHL